MNNRSGVVTFFVFLFLVVMIALQILSMIQSDRLYERLNTVLERLASGRVVTTVSDKTGSADLPGVVRIL